MVDAAALRWKGSGIDFLYVYPFAFPPGFGTHSKG
jgi:hypothetical protein